MTKAKQKISKTIPTQIESDRLIIRKYEARDGKGFFDLLERNENRTFLKEHVDEATTILTLEEANLRVKEFSAFWENQERFVMGIWIRNTNQFIGNIWIEPKNWDVPSFEIGYYLDKGFTGKGYATEDVKRSMEFIFENLHAHKIILITRDTNERSYRLAERLEFILEGHFNECNIKNGKRFGLYYY